MDSIINTFHIDWKIIAAQALNFSIVFVVLYIFALKPLAKIMKDRTETIEKGLKDAKENNEILNNSKTEYTNTLNKAKAEAHTIFQEGKKEVALLIENGKKTLESEKVKMLAETKGEIASLAVKIAEKLVKGKMDGTFDEKTIQEIKNL